MTDTSNTDDNTVESAELLSNANYTIAINGQKVWESKGESMLVDRVVIRNARGEVTVIGSSMGDTYLEIEVNERSYDAPETYLDMIENRQANERRERFEPDTSDRVNDEAYVAADPETGKPVERDSEPTTVGDVEF